MLNQMYEYAGVALLTAGSGGDPISNIIVASIIGAAIAVLAGMAPALGQGIATARAVEAVGRQPEAAGQIRAMLLLGSVVAETGAIYGLTVSLILIFANPFVTMYQEAMGLI